MDTTVRIIALVVITILTFLGPIITMLLVLVKVQDYHVAVNSKMDAYMRVANKAAKAEGVLEGRGKRSV